MKDRFCLKALLLASLVLPFVGCGSSTDVDSISISPTTVTLGPGATVQLTALGTIGHGNHPASTQDITATATWTSSIAGVATVSSTGVVTGVNAGLTTITASIRGFGGIITSNQAAITVVVPTSAEPLVSLAVNPATQTASSVNQTAQFIAIATTDSGSTVNLTDQSARVDGATISAAKWTSSDPSVASVNPTTGVATALSAGTATITAIASNPDGSVVSGSAKYTVIIPSAPEPLVSLAIVPVAQSATAVGQTAQYIAIGTTSTGTTVNLTNQPATVGGSIIKAATWTSSNASTATIGSFTGLATAAGAGVTTITAIASNPDGSVVTAVATYTVTLPSAPEPLVSLAIVPATQTASVANQTAQFIAIGTTATGTTVNLTNKSATIGGATISAATWSSSSASTATINANTGLATAVNSGVTAITAIASNPDGTVVTGTAVFTVSTSGSQEPLLSLAILPGTQSVQYPGQTSQLLAIGTFSAAPTTQNLTGNNTTYPIRWQSSDSSVATVGSPEQAGTTPGLVTATGQGTASITAYAANPDGTLVYAVANFIVAGGAPEPFTALTISPGSQTLSATGQTAQFIAIGTTGNTGLLQDVSNSAQVKWSSSIPSIATVTTYPASPAGVVAGVSPGTTTITAKLTNPDQSVVTATATVTVTASPAPEPLLSITVLPASVTLGNLDGTAQFLAYGTFSTAPTVMDITNGVNHNGFTSPVTWISLPNPNVFPIESGGTPGETGGLATAYGSGTADIYAVATNPDGTLVYSSTPAEFNCPLVLESTDPTTGAITPGSCNPDTIAPTLLVTLTVFNAGLNQANWLITADSATGTKDVIHCGPGSTSGGSVCAATYPVNTTVTLTAPAEPGVAFGGWSFNCANTAPVTAAGPNSCTVTLGTGSSSNVSVGAIFN